MKHKRLQKRQYYFVKYIKKFSAIFRRFPIISKNFWRQTKIPKDCRSFPTTTEDFWRLPKMSEDWHSAGSKIISDLITNFWRADKNLQGLTMLKDYSFFTKKKTFKH